MEVSNLLQDAYNKQYSDRTENWRRIGAIGKTKNIIEITESYKVNSVIDVGAGDGNVLAFLDQQNFGKEFFAAEISESSIEQIRKKKINKLKEIFQFDGYKLPCSNKFFNMAVCSHVIEQVEFPRKLLREIKRVSEYQVFEVPIDFSFFVDKKMDHFLSYGHINIYHSFII